MTPGERGLTRPISNRAAIIGVIFSIAVIFGAGIVGPIITPDTTSQEGTP